MRKAAALGLTLLILSGGAWAPAASRAVGARPAKAAHGLAGGPVLTRVLDENTDPRKNGYAVGALPQNACSTLVSVCVHWVATTVDAVPTTDQNPANGRPDQVDAALGVLETVLETYGGLGFRAPKPDIVNPLSLGPNPNGSLDVYLADLGSDVFGKCASDDPNKGNLGTALYQYYDVSAYCVLDNDLERSLLEVTAAHEVFHAVQYAYDYLEDLWFMEGTAVAMEDVVFDDANDNLRYLSNASPLTDSHTSVDYGAERHDYGSWIFWRFLTEYYYVDQPSGGPDPTVIREVWKQADAAQPAPGAQAPPDDFSLQAAEHVGGDVFKEAFSRFGAYNLAPVDFYEEGDTYPAAPVNATAKVSKAKSKLPMTARLPHMTNHTVAITPGKGVTGSAKLKIAVNGPAQAAGPRATVVVDPVDPEKPNAYKPVSLNAQGDGSIAVNFGRGKIARVVVVLTNASTRIDQCFRGTFYTCGGTFTDDGKTYAFTATLKQ